MNLNSALADLWENPSDKPGFAPPPEWLPALESMFSPHWVAEHLAKHGFLITPTTPEIARLLVEIHDLWHSSRVVAPDHQHMGIIRVG